MESQSTEGIPGKAGRWLAILSAILTIVLTLLNSYWSREISKVDQDLKLREAELKELQLQLDAGKEKLARYTFVYQLFDGVLNQDQAQKTLTVNLITLALTEKEAEQLFAGLQASENQQARDVGTLGSDVVALQGLVTQMNDAVKKNRLGAVENLINNHRGNSLAVELAIQLIEPPKLKNLSPSGRINVLVFLRNTELSAWSPELVARAKEAVKNIRDKAARGITAIGNQTEDALSKLESHLNKVEE